MSKDGVMKAWEATIRKTQAAKKRANSIFGSTSVAHVTDDENEDDSSESSSNNGGLGGRSNGEPYHAEKILPNGDYYTGQWHDNFPHGHGKYLWTDGCMYVGEWYKGKTMGRGRFSWPSGATYEGEFKSGYMDGTGTYIGPNGDAYKGQWIMNMKHGHGVMSFSNGDLYDGDWRRGLQDGQGRYQWKNGNHYVGEWRNGVVCGKGSFMWVDRDIRYDGNWEDFLPKGNGTLKWEDGSFYVGNWSKDSTERNGTYYPSSLQDSDSEDGEDIRREWDAQLMYDEYLANCHICPCEKVYILPSQKKLAVWNSSKADHETKPRRMSVDGRVSVGVERTLDRMNMLEGEDGSGRNPMLGRKSVDVVDLLSLNMGGRTPPRLMPMKAPKVVRRQGETICKGHKNYELMLNLQLGIR